MYNIFIYIDLEERVKKLKDYNCYAKIIKIHHVQILYIHIQGVTKLKTSGARRESIN